ncbi:FAD-dependent oxidoreductase [Pelodictyon luteolum]|uniref:Carotenoid isomerase, putative n=1 Tax=Chlorobium luteolum (strain DSM 273 / BCRC 81028 / 2530) TaxID=319225 RepID=Q3B572_CHLL3|nr:FAD-dependent oxidoreductase [Pelodictyon luteolum]ABB23509.1 carotenoid isomerase, putative [Pelodictyon luteolum DSM 273]
MSLSDATADVLVIGAGIGGLTAAALLQERGFRVVVLEKSRHPGGSCSSFRREGYTFDAGASVFYGFAENGRSGTLNLHTRVFRRLGVLVPSVPDPVQIHYHLPGGLDLRAHFDRARFLGELSAAFPHEAAGIKRFYRELEAVYDILSSLPAGSLEDPRHLLSVGAAYPAKTLALALKTFRSMGRTARRHISDPDLLRFIDIEAYSWALQDAIGTPLVNAGICLADRHHGGINYPLGGSGAIPRGLVEGLEKFGGVVRYGAGVERILVEGGAAVGVRLEGGEELRARAVVSNATIWDTFNRLVDDSRFRIPEERFLRAPSWFQLYLGVEAGVVPEGMHVHHVQIDAWEGYDQPGGTLYCSVPSLLDPSLAPPAHHVVHAFVTDEAERWEGLERGSEAYTRRKQSMEAELMGRLEGLMPGIGSGVKLRVSASPLTHERWLNRYKGSYGPLLKPGQNILLKPQNRTALKNLFAVGDSTFPGQGVIAVTYSGVSCASLVSSHFGRPLVALE